MLAVLEACPLRAVTGQDLLPTSGSAATVGTWLHDFAERADLGALSWKDGLHALDAFLDVRGASLSEPPAGWTRFAWLEACHRALRHAREGPAERKSGRDPRRGSRMAKLPSGPESGSLSDHVWRTGTGTHTELTIFDNVLRVTGRVDRVTFERDRVVITDLKTGRAADRDGKPTRSAWLQMSAYGAYARRIRPEAEVVLVVNGETRVEWKCGDDCAAEAGGVVHAAADLWPDGEPVPAHSLARPGAACLFCSQRPVCPAYPTASSSWRRDGADHAFPDDVCGTIVMKAPDDHTLDLVTDEGTRFRLRAVPNSIWHGAVIGARLDTYGLQRSARVDGRHYLLLTLDGANRVYYQAA